MAPENDKRRHIILTETASTERFRPVGGGRSTPFHTPVRDRHVHGQSLISQLQEIQNQDETFREARRAHGIDLGDGICMTFEGEPGFDLKIESLEFQQSGIELLTAIYKSNIIDQWVFY